MRKILDEIARVAVSKRESTRRWVQGEKDVERALRPYLKKFRAEISSWDMGDPSDAPDDVLLQRAWDALRLDGWKPEEVVENPGGAAREVLAIWRM